MSVILPSLRFATSIRSFLVRFSRCPRSIGECNFRAVEESSPMGPGTSDIDTIHPIKLRGGAIGGFGTFGREKSSPLFRAHSSFSPDRSIYPLYVGRGDLSSGIPREHFIEIMLRGKGLSAAANLKGLPEESELTGETRDSRLFPVETAAQTFIC